MKDNFDVEIDLDFENSNETSKNSQSNNDWWTDDHSTTRSPINHHRNRRNRQTQRRQATYSTRKHLSKNALLGVVIVIGIIGCVLGGIIGSILFEPVEAHYTGDYWDDTWEFVMAEGWNFFGKIGIVLLYALMLGGILATITYTVLKGAYDVY